MTIQRIDIITADITTLDVDVIVNAAEKSLMGGSGVDGAIHAAAGPNLFDECKTIPGGCPTGEARMTHGHRLLARYIIHTVGPIWQGGEVNEDSLLSQCYRRSLGLMVGNNLKTIAFPAISTGVCRFPLERAATIALNTTTSFLTGDDRIKKVIFCCMGEASRDAHKDALAGLGG
jgi:O-acetyl-ADP-ribose deacetylase (regulator of RNase III)